MTASAWLSSNSCASKLLLLRGRPRPNRFPGWKGRPIAISHLLWQGCQTREVLSRLTSVGDCVRASHARLQSCVVGPGMHDPLTAGLRRRAHCSPVLGGLVERVDALPRSAKVIPD